MKNIFVALLVILIGVVVGWFVMKPTIKNLQTTKPVNVSGETVSTSPSETGSYQPVEVPVSGIPTGSNTTKGGVTTQTKTPATSATVSYTDSGFRESVVYVKLGTTVTFVNASAQGMWVASNPHPTHTDLPGFDEKTSVNRGGTYQYTFVKVGSWKYHNHLNPSDTGVVVVSQ